MSPAADAGGRLARTLPGRFYHDPAVWQREQDRLFGRLWVAAGRADQLPAAGCYRTVQVGDESVLVVRDDGGALRAFLNVCRHRGAQLCPAAAGQTRTLQCRYHAWTYGLDGRLSARRASRTRPPSIAAPSGWFRSRSTPGKGSCG